MPPKRLTKPPRPSGKDTMSVSVPARPPMQNVASQKHYGGSATNRVELIDVIAVIEFWRGNAIKYLFRAGTKVGVPFEEDIAKAKVYIEYGEQLASGEPVSQSLRKTIDKLNKEIA